jgi:hypothetical protein
MISREDIIGMCGLTEEEVDAVGEHEHLGEVAAACLGAYLLHEAHGSARIAGMIRDDLRAALKRGDRGHAKELLAALRHFLHAHPDAMH